MKKLFLVLVPLCVVVLVVTAVVGFQSRAPRRKRRAAARVLVLDLDETLVHFSPAEGTLTERPHVHAFLKRVSKEFDYLATFTAGTRDYASPILDRLARDAGVTFRKRFYREDCTLMPGEASGTFVFAKDLTKLGEKDLSGVLLLDNTPSAYSLQPQCGVPIQSFYGDPDDVALLEVRFDS